MHADRPLHRRRPPPTLLSPEPYQIGGKLGAVEVIGEGGDGVDPREGVGVHTQVLAQIILPRPVQAPRPQCSALQSRYLEKNEKFEVFWVILLILHAFDEILS